MKLFRSSKTTKRQPSFKQMTADDSKVLSYNRSRYKSPRQEKQRNVNRLSSDSKNMSGKATINKLPTYIIIATLLVSLVYSLSLGTSPKIVALEAKSDSSLLRNKDIYQSAAQKILQGSVLNQSKVTINTTEFSRQMKQKFPELAEASITLPLAGRRPIVELSATKPELILRPASGPEYLVSDEGVAIIKSSEVFGLDNLKLPTVEDKNTNEMKVGKRVLTKSDVTFITTVLYQLLAKNIQAEAINLPAIPGELHLKPKDKGYFVKFNLQGDANIQTGALLAIEKRFASDKTVPKQYVDVRVGDRVYFQ